MHCVLACCLVAALVAMCSTSTAADDVIMPNAMDRQDIERLYDPRRKRPFCNAFTGCGKKRSDESMSTLLELNSEPAVADLSRQILSEAKLWEAIQEARDELLRRQHDKLALQMNQLAPQLSSQMRQMPATSFRKRRSVDPSEFARRAGADVLGIGRFF